MLYDGLTRSEQFAMAVVVLDLPLNCPHMEVDLICLVVLQKGHGSKLSFEIQPICLHLRELMCSHTIFPICTMFACSPHLRLGCGNLSRFCTAKDAFKRMDASRATFAWHPLARLGQTYLGKSGERLL